MSKTEPKNIYWRCHECDISGYTQGPESHTCPGPRKIGCNRCWDKGYSTELSGGNSGTGPLLIIRFCTCKKGKLAQRRKQRIMVFETQTYKLPVDFKKITSIKVNGKHYSRHQGNGTKQHSRQGGSRTKRAGEHQSSKKKIS